MKNYNKLALFLQNFYRGSAMNSRFHNDTKATNPTNPRYAAN